MSVVLTQAYLRGLNTGYNATLKSSLAEQLAKGTFLAPLLLEETNASGVSHMEYNSAAGIPALEEWIGEQEMKNLSTVQFTIANKVFSRLIGLKREVLERRQAQIYERDIKNAGVAYSLFREKRMCQKLVDGFDAAKFTDYTGSAFFATARKIAKGKPGTLANKGTKKLSATNFETAVASLRTRTDAEGNILGLGSQMHLIVSPTYESTAEAIVKLDTLSGGGKNPNHNKAQLHVWPWLSAISEHAWFLIDTAWLKPAIYQTEVPLASFMQTNPEDSGVIRSGEFLYQLYHRGELSLSEPLCAYGSTGADAA